jgi:hypothetical protein
MTTLPKAVVAEDRLLDDKAKNATAALMELRWHWTINPDNPKRVSQRAYAAAVGRSQKSILASARGWQMKLDAEANEGDVAFTRELGEYVEMAKVGELKRAAAEAVAAAHGIRVDNVLSHRRNDVNDVVNIARSAAERRGTTPEEEVARVADHQKRAADTRASAAEARKSRHTMRWLGIEGKVTKALRELNAALAESEGVEFTAEEREMIAESVGKLRAVLNLLDMRIIGTADIDWDAEAAKLGTTQ